MVRTETVRGRGGEGSSSMRRERGQLDEMREFDAGNFPERMSLEKSFIDASLMKDVHEKASEAWKQ
ncbi:hypothetical protein QTJ16_000777 [Diplocarpon rosae]|uniref:Uncharacterized protein n=1 Tax=Diplocarpon rosae TaxID=946125 RepID=A0AAD9WFN0_9HELO|nr:hypothetical protein QTJ16_000777 [Diplocarpon rosae]